MKGYKKQLEEFIGYVLVKYQKDEKVNEFRTIFEKQTAKREKQRAVAKTPKTQQYAVTISGSTAGLCKALVSAEIERARMLGTYNDKFVLDLTIAKKELNGEYLTGLLHRINRWG
jgi:hypothetical protein